VRRVRFRPEGEVLIVTEKHEAISCLKNNSGRSFSSFFFNRGRILEYVRAGSTLQRVHQDKMVETAQVSLVGTDSYGIPHVSFQVSFRRPDRNKFDGGARMLALKSFADQYRERVSSMEVAAASIVPSR